jgi:hypothetical protein
MQGSQPNLVPSSTVRNHCACCAMPRYTRMLCDCKRTPNQVAQCSAYAGAAMSGLYAANAGGCAKYWEIGRLGDWEIGDGRTHP